MFELERGDKDALEGRVIVYAENLRPKEEAERFVAIYASATPADLYLFDEETLHESDISEIETKWKQAKETVQARTKGMTEPLVPFASRIMSLANQEDIFEIPGDVVYAGKAVDHEILMTLIQSMTTVYIINYNTQLNENESAKRSEKPPADEAPSDEPLAVRVVRLIGQLCHALEAGNDDERDGTIRELRQIGASGPFSNEISNIVGVAQTQHPERTKLIDLYVEMIAAVQAEEYRKAAEIKRQIDTVS